MKFSPALVEFLLFLEVFNTHGASLFSGVFSSFGVYSLSFVFLFPTGVSHLQLKGYPKDHLHFGYHWFVCPTILRKSTDCSPMMLHWD